MLNDLRFGVRMLIKNPGSTAVAVLSLALEIGANSAIFSVLSATLLRERPYPKDPDRVFMIMVFELKKASWEAVLGRTFLPEENRPGSEHVCVLTDGLWQRRIRNFSWT